MSFTIQLTLAGSVLVLKQPRNYMIFVYSLFKSRIAGNETSDTLSVLKALRPYMIIKSDVSDHFLQE